VLLFRLSDVMRQHGQGFGSLWSVPPFAGPSRLLTRNSKRVYKASRELGNP